MSGKPEILSIPIREDVVVRFLGIPHDLTESEARKIAAVVEAMATPAGLQALKEKE